MKRLTIIGGGFAGAKAAKKLENRFKITLIDEKDYFEFTPGILRSIVNPEHLDKIQVLHKDYLKNSGIIRDSVVKVKGKKVFLKKGKSLTFDYLIIASGSRYETPIKDRKTIIASRSKELKDYHKELEKNHDLILIGGGLVGVELAGEIADYYPDKKVMIIHSRNKLIQRNDKKSIKYAEKFLKRNGVKIIYNERVEKKVDSHVVTEKGKKYKCDLVFFCTGIKPNSDFMDRKKLDQHGFIKVNKFLQMEGNKNVFVCGDIAGIKEEKTAQGSEKQANHVVRNLFYLEQGKPMEKYRPRRRPMVISLGRWNGIFEYKKFVLTGIIPAFLKWFVEMKTMIRYKRPM